MSQINSLQVSLACESFNNHARICHQCSDIGASFHRGEVPCATGDALGRPIRGMFKHQQAQMERDFPGVDQDVIIDSAMSGPAYNLLRFLNERRRDRIRKTPSPVMHQAIPVPMQVRPTYQHGYYPTGQIEVGGRSGARYGHSRSGSDTTSSNPSNSPQQQFYHPHPHSYPQSSHLQVPGVYYTVEHETGRRSEKKQVRFQR